MSLRPRHVEFDPKWSVIKETIQDIITLNYIHRTVWNDRFNDIYYLCVSTPESLGEKLYAEIKLFLEDHVKKLYHLVVKSTKGLLVAYHNYWNEFSNGIKYLDTLFYYLNTQCIKQSRISENIPAFDLHVAVAENQMLEIGELGLQLWKKHIIEDVKKCLVEFLLEGIWNDKLGDNQNQSVVQGVIQSFIQVEEYNTTEPLELYNVIFENPFIKKMGEYYALESTRLLLENCCSQYMEEVLRLLENENLLCKKYLHPSSYSKVLQEFQNQMIGAHLPFLHGECKRMVQQEDLKDLQNMFLLLKSIPNAVNPLIQDFQEHVTKIGLDVVNSLGGKIIPCLFAEYFLTFHSKYRSLINDVFICDQQFIRALDEACAAVLKSIYNPEELLAKYCDSLLKKGTKACSEDELEDKLSSAITIFRFVEGKDIFQKFYARLLAKRLISKQSLSMDAEEAMISKLKQNCGYDFTRKLHRMFVDMNVSSDLNALFYEYLQTKNTQFGINFSISVLTAGSWPLGQSAVSEFVIPQEIEQCVQKFEYFYKTKFNGRKLTWLHHLCNAELKLSYLNKPYIVTMSTYQMGILLLFQTSHTQTYAELQENTKLSDEQLVKQVQSLVDSKLLMADKAINKKSSFSLNMDYANKRTKFKLPVVLQKETVQQEVEQTRAVVDEDRKLNIQAAIVRIMKSRKTLKHNALIGEVINQAKFLFVPDISMIKKCIEVLIEKQYIERAPNSTDEYCYVA